MMYISCSRVCHTELDSGLCHGLQMPLAHLPSASDYVNLWIYGFRRTFTVNDEMETEGDESALAIYVKQAFSEYPHVKVCNDCD